MTYRLPQTVRGGTMALGLLGCVQATDPAGATDPRSATADCCQQGLEPVGASAAALQRTPASTLDALSQALDDEYRARATYAAVLERFGPVRPFVNIVRAEQRHINMLLAEYNRLGETPEPDAWVGEVEAPSSLLQACEEAVQGEIDNAALYDQLLLAVDDPQLRDVMLRLQAASQDNHLPAFERCVARQAGAGSAPTGFGGPGPGRGGRGMGRGPG